jgi:hypothetical protein
MTEIEKLFMYDGKQEKSGESTKKLRGGEEEKVRAGEGLFLSVYWQLVRVVESHSGWGGAPREEGSCGQAAETRPVGSSGSSPGW